MAVQFSDSQCTTELIAGRKVGFSVSRICLAPIVYIFYPKRLILTKSRKWAIWVEFATYNFILLCFLCLCYLLYVSVYFRLESKIIFLVAAFAIAAVEFRASKTKWLPPLQGECFCCHYAIGTNISSALEIDDSPVVEICPECGSVFPLMHKYSGMYTK